MAEFMLKDLVKKRGMERDFLIASSATSAEEIGNPVHPGTASRLAREGISTAGKYAVQLKRTMTVTTIFWAWINGTSAI